MGGAASAVEQSLAPNTTRRHTRHIVRMKSFDLYGQFMTTYDATNTGTLNKDEVKALTEAMLTEFTASVGGVTDDDIELIMRIGGTTAKAEVTAEELPLAISAMVSVRQANEGLVELFDKYDVDRTGRLPEAQLKGLLTEINDDVEVPAEDVAYVINQVTVDKATGICLRELKAAIACWYSTADASYLDQIKADCGLAEPKAEPAAEKPAAEPAAAAADAPVAEPAAAPAAAPGAAAAPAE